MDTTLKLLHLSQMQLFCSRKKIATFSEHMRHKGVKLSAGRMNILYKSFVYFNLFRAMFIGIHSFDWPSSVMLDNCQSMQWVWELAELWRKCCCKEASMRKKGEGGGRKGHGHCLPVLYQYWSTGIWGGGAVALGSDRSLAHYTSMIR